MSTYSYQALDSDGQTVSDQVSAESVSAAITELESRGLVIQSIQQLDAPTGLRTSPAQLDTGSMLDQRFEEVIRRRDVFIPALTAFADEMPAGHWKRDVRQLVSGLQQGMSASELRERHSKWLPLLESGMASESTQTLTLSIEQAVREGESRRQLRYALSYPLVMFTLVSVVLTGLCLIVVPVFGDMFREFDLELPAMTLLLVSFADEIRFHPIRFLAVTLGIVLLVIVLLRMWMHFSLSTRFLGMFTAGNAANVNAMASFSGQLADLLSIDVPLPDALRVAGNGCQHRYFQRVASELSLQAQHDAKSISRSPVAHNFPGNLIYALTAGPNGSPSIPLIRELSAMYRDRVRERTDWTTGVVAQFTIVAVGVAVAFVVIALYLPLITLISALS